ncbi:hypothetical protein GQ61_01235 [Candidatus Nucleicultrix amoebiphila FS5]|uniref:DUF3570 domain-containing protein n=2 Tax=Candidatus Nucleicultrix TaxID=1509243 RepID=A0A1W6N310_9PROT|nr:hypothetical protein GQ61_01235 [Candidatus Nucleicultrix amoebiphila FS5]
MKNKKKQTSLSSLTAIAMTLPGIASAQENSVLRPETALKYTHYDETKNRYQIDVYNGFLSVPITEKLAINLNFNRETMSGASPRMNASEAFLNPNASTHKLVEVKSGATIEDQRHEVKAKLIYKGDADYGLGSAYSIEKDYRSTTLFGDTTLYFNKKNTAVTLAVSLSGDNVDPSAKPPTLSLSLPSRVYWNMGHKNTQKYHLGVRQDLTKQSFIQQNFEYTVDTGFLSDPYKLIFTYGDARTSIRPGTLFVGPSLTFPVGFSIDYDRRPNFREAYSAVTRYVHYLESFGSSAHFDYRFSANSWKIKSHTFTLAYYQPWETWEFNPSVRFYTQSEADFYGMAFTNAPGAPFPARPLLQNGNGSSDYRLASFGSINGEFRVSKNFTPDIKASILVGYNHRSYRYGFNSKDVQKNTGNLFATRYASISIKVLF